MFLHSRQNFYCQPSSSFEKRSCEVNHELLIRILHEGTSFDNLTQDDINLIMLILIIIKEKTEQRITNYNVQFHPWQRYPRYYSIYIFFHYHTHYIIFSKYNNESALN